MYHAYIPACHFCRRGACGMRPEHPVRDRESCEATPSGTLLPAGILYPTAGSRVPDRLGILFPAVGNRIPKRRD